MSAEAFFDHYKSNGFNFSKKVLSTYCLSLYTKPFVILSGISGTGKTKIAHLFNSFEEAQSKELSKSTSNNLDDYIIMNVTAGARNGDGRANLKYSDVDKIFEPNEIDIINKRIAELIKLGVDNNITEPKIFTVETQNGSFEISMY